MALKSYMYKYVGPDQEYLSREANTPVEVITQCSGQTIVLRFDELKKTEMDGVMKYPNNFEFVEEVE